MNIKLYLSKESYQQKPDKAAGIIKQVKSYELVDIDIESLYNKLANGHFMHHECGFSEPNSGGNDYTFKKRLLKQAQLLCIDLDYKFKFTKSNGDIILKEYNSSEMPKWNDELLLDLKYNEIDIAPTFWIESFSAGVETKKKIVGNSVHLFYVFYDPIMNVNDYEKTAITIIYILYNALKAKGYDIPLEHERCPFDPVSTDMFQGLWGSYNKAHGFSGKLYFWDEFRNTYKSEMKDIIFQKDSQETEPLRPDEIERTISAYSTVKTIDDIDISKSQYIKYKKYFGHQEGFHIISTLKNEYNKIEGQDDDGKYIVDSKQSLCYQICKKLLLNHCNDFFDKDENHFYREYKRCKMYRKKGSNDAAYMNHVIRLIGDTGAIPLIEYKEESEESKEKIIKLNKTEYLSDKKSEIMQMMDNDKINFIIADPGLGKTVFAKSLSGNTLIIELYNSIIQSEEKFDSDEFIKFKEGNYIKDELVSTMNVCSANKFCFWYKNKDNMYFKQFYNDDKCLFDNIILDESHLLCLSNYRYDIMGETVECLKKLKIEYPDVNIIIMTGTPFGESTIFDNLNTITIEAEPRYNKKFYMIQTSSIEGYMKELIKDTLSKGLRVFIPVDSENWFDTFIEACIEDGIVAKNMCYYFNQPKNMEETERYILNTKLIGDIQILGTSSYMSVGIDLEDWKTEFVTIIPSGASMTGNFSGIEVEQFANRHRKQNLEVHYVISKNESNNKKPFLQNSCRALLNIKNELLQRLYHTNPIVIKLPLYLLKKNDNLEVHEDMFNVYVYYKDMQPIISHPMNVYEYMQKKGWTCEWKTVENTHRGIDTKEHRDIEKANGVEEFMQLLDEWNNGNYPIINVKESIGNEFELIKHKSKNSLFDVELIEVEFTNYYAKNTLFNMFLSIREYLTGAGTYNLIKDAYNGDKINMSFISRNLLAIKLINSYIQKGVWKTISDRLSEFYSDYSTIYNGVYSENKDEFQNRLDNTVQQIWDELSNNIDEEYLKMAFRINYNNVTENLISDFMEGIKLVQTMYLSKHTFQKKINDKNYKIAIYSWNNNKMAKYEIRNDKKNNIVKK